MKIVYVLSKLQMNTVNEALTFQIDYVPLSSNNRLRESDSLVVIGGQQAGLLTGPLYSINKLISIVQIAREQERILNRPVIPVFWIAGEDHDLDEINHIFTVKDNEIYKHRLVTE